MSTKKKATGAKAKARTNAKPDSNLKRGARGEVRGSLKTATAATPGTGSKPGAGSTKDATAVAKTPSRPKAGKMETAIRKNMKDISAKIESMVPPGSPERIAAGVAAVAGGALIAGAALGAGPTALAGAAGYLAYKGLSGPETKKGGSGSVTRKRAAAKRSATRKRKT